MQDRFTSGAWPQDPAAPEGRLRALATLVPWQRPMKMHMIAEDSRDEWNAFVAAAPLGDVLQCWEWGELKARTGWEPLYLAVREQGRLVATALVLKRELPGVGRSFFYCPRGPVWDSAAPGSLEKIVEAIRVAARQQRAIACKVDPPVPREDEVLTSRLRKLGLRPGPRQGGFGVTQPRAVMKVDLGVDEQALLASFHPKWRYNIRLAQRKGVTVRPAGREDVDTFYDLLLITGQRDGFRVRTRSYFHDIWDLIIAPGLGHMVLAEVNGVPVSGAIVFALGHQCWYVYGASDNHHRNLMPNHLVQWELMRWAMARGCTVYDMRGVSPEVGGKPVEPRLAGLNRFKRGFGARYVEYIGDWDCVFSRTWYFAFQRLLPMARKVLARRSGVEAEA